MFFAAAAFAGFVFDAGGAGRFLPGEAGRLLAVGFGRAFAARVVELLAMMRKIGADVRADPPVGRAVCTPLPKRTKSKNWEALECKLPPGKGQSGANFLQNAIKMTRDVRNAAIARGDAGFGFAGRQFDG